MDDPVCGGVVFETLSGGLSCDRYFECGVSTLDLDVAAYRRAHDDHRGRDDIAP
jgi:hypothetical protein